MEFVNSTYDSESGTSIVIMRHMGERFLGTAYVHPKDMENASEYAGCNLAELRATVKALKYERRLAKYRADEAIDFLKSCECYKNFDKESPTAKVIYRQVNRRIKRVNDITDHINDLLEQIKVFASRRQIIINAIKRKKEVSKKDK